MLLESPNPQRPDEADYFIQQFASLYLNITNAFFAAAGSRSMNGLKFSAEVIRAPIIFLPSKLNVIAAQLAWLWCGDNGLHGVFYSLFPHAVQKSS